MSRSVPQPGLLVIAPLLFVAACGLPPAPERPPNLLLVTVDTLRADRLGPYGGSVPTPHVDRMAAAGTLFENAAAPMPVTRPSHFTMLTSRYPREHGATDNHVSLPESELTVVEVLREAGYRTAAVTGVGILDHASGVAQGFETFDPPAPGTGRRNAEEVVQRAAAWLRTLGPEERFFLWVHVFDPHMPYNPPRYFRPPGDGPDSVGWGVIRQMARENRGDVSRADYERTLALYGGEVASVDAAFGLLELELEERQVAERTATIFTADHGECFENGNFFQHAGCLYDGAIRVPLIVRYPGRVPAGERVLTPVEHVDLAPTLLSFAGLDLPPSFVGAPLFERDGDAADLPAERYALIQHPLSDLGGLLGRRNLWKGIESVMGEPLKPLVYSTEQVGLRSERWKYIATRGRAEELYDLREDPAERRDLAAERRDVVRRLRAVLRRELEEHPLTLLDRERLNPELRRQLETLGYL